MNDHEHVEEKNRNSRQENSQVYGVTAYILLLLSLIIYFYHQLTESSTSESHPFLQCMLFSGVGGCTYCLRGIYLNYCVKNQWTSRWIPWYIIRPIVSLICGLICFVFVKAGVLIFEAEQVDVASNYALYAISFISGYNVDNFMKKLEEVSKVVFGINESNISNTANTNIIKKKTS